MSKIFTSHDSSIGVYNIRNRSVCCSKARSWSRGCKTHRNTQQTPREDLGGEKNKILSSTCTCISSPVTSTIRHFLQIKYVAIGSACNWELRYSRWVEILLMIPPNLGFIFLDPSLSLQRCDISRCDIYKMWHLQDVTFTRCNIYKIWHLHFCQWLLNH